MTKKIRLIDDSATIPVAADTIGVTPDAAPANIDDVAAKQLMKYLEAIDWKLWEMLKLMKADMETKSAIAEAEEEK